MLGKKTTGEKAGGKKLCNVHHSNARSYIFRLKDIGFPPRFAVGQTGVETWDPTPKGWKYKAVGRPEEGDDKRLSLQARRIRAGALSPSTTKALRYLEEPIVVFIIAISIN